MSHGPSVVPGRQLAVLAYGSILHTPGPALSAMLDHRRPARTPFPVEYARASARWGDGPVLAPHRGGGPVDGGLLVLRRGVTLGEAVEALRVREGIPSARGVAEVAPDDQGRDLTILTAALPANLASEEVEPRALARRAARSVGHAPRNGVAYLRNAIAAGVDTPLTGAYAQAVLELAGTTDLVRAEQRLLASRGRDRDGGDTMAWDDVARWQPVDLAAAFAMGDPVQPVDVRDLGYRESDRQVKGAVRIQPLEFEQQVGGLPDDMELIFYCDRAGEANSLKIALWAFDNGLSRVGVLVGGWNAWTEGDYPTEDKPASP